MLETQFGRINLPVWKFSNILKLVIKVVYTLYLFFIYLIKAFNLFCLAGVKINIQQFEIYISKPLLSEQGAVFSYL